MTAIALESVQAFLRTAPVDLDRMARALRIAITRDETLSPATAASLAPQGGRYRITLNGTMSPHRQRTALARAIAHCLLHPDAIGEGLTEDAHGRCPPLAPALDLEADRGALDLLMPADLVRAFWNLGVRMVPEMARRFDVTYDAAAERLRALGLDRLRN